MSLAIYTLKRILSLGKQRSKAVHIKTSTTCRTAVFSLVALYCSNGYIILRYAGPSNDTRNVLPIVRYIPWSVSSDSFESNNTDKDLDKKNNKSDNDNNNNNSTMKNNKLYNHAVKALTFNDNGKQLFVLCADGSVYCLPALAIVMETNPAKSSNNNSKNNSNNLIRSVPANQLLQSYARTPEHGESTSDNSSIRQARHAVRDARRLVKKGSGGVSIVFWRSFQGKSYLLLGTEQGRMIIVDCGKENFGDYVLGLFIAPKHRVDKINILTDGSKQRRWRYAIINTSKDNKDGHNTRIKDTYRILLERPKAFVQGLMSPYKDANKMSRNEYVNLCDHLSSSEADNPLSISGGIGFSLGSIRGNKSQKNSPGSNNYSSPNKNNIGNNSNNSNNNNASLQLHPDFIPQKITFVENYMSNNNNNLSEQHLGSWQGSGLGLYDQEKFLFSLFSVDAPLPQRYPLFEFNMPSSTENILYTKRVLFVGCKDDVQNNSKNYNNGKTIVKLFSSFLLSGVSTDRNDDNDINADSNDTNGNKSGDSNIGLIQTFEIPTDCDTNIINFEYAPWCFTKSEDLYLEGVIMITRDAIYEFQPRSIERIEENFQNLIDQEEEEDIADELQQQVNDLSEINEDNDNGDNKSMNVESTSPEQYAQVLGLNILALYEQAGDRKLKEGKQNAARALALYKLSNMSVHQILKRLILAGRPDLAATHAAFILSSNANNETSEFNKAEITDLSHLAIKCYLSCVERLPNNGDDNKQNGGDQIDDKTNMNTYVGNDTISLQLCSDQAKIVEPNAPFGLLSFLEKNKIYDLKFVLKLLCQTGLYGAIFVAAHSRKNILIALELFALSSAPKLNQLCYQYLLQHNYIKEICLASESSIFHALTADKQFQLLFKNNCIITTNVQISLIVYLYPVLSSRIYEWSSEQILHATIVVENLLQELNNMFMNSNNKKDNANRRRSLCVLSECLIHFLLFYVSKPPSSVEHDEERQRQLKRLEVFVSLQTKYFRPNVIECLTVDFECFSIGALMYESNNRFDKAVNLRLSEIQSNYVNSSNEGSMDGEFCNLLLNLIESHILKISISDRLIRVKSLRKIFHLWFKLKFDVKILEAVILKHISSLGYEFSAILFPQHDIRKLNNNSSNNNYNRKDGINKDRRNDDSMEALYPHFSKDVCFALCIDQVLPSQHENRRRRRASSIGLLGGICTNLAKGINDNREIVLHAEDIDGICRESNNGTSSGGDILVFSCGHVYSKQIFFEEVLEHFKQRLLKLRYTLPATLAVILKEYRKEHISCACPKCLIMYFEDIDQHIEE